MFDFLKKHENNKALIWMLAKTDFKLRYHGSVLGYVWALLQPLAMFAILNFVFSSIFARGGNVPFYSLQLITGIMMFTFFNEGTSSGMRSLLSKAQLITKTYVPKWTVILASTIHSVLTYCMSLIIVIMFFIWKGLTPSFEAIAMFIVSSFFIYIMIVSFSFLTASLYIKFRDLSMIWDVITRMLFYATPIIFPLTAMPENIQRLLLFNPMAFVIHFTKESLINNHFPDFWQMSTFTALIFVILMVSIFVYQKTSKGIAESI